METGLAMPLVRLIYASRATRRLDRSDLEDILATARSRNAAQGVTGYLLYDDGQFIQAIEGEEAVVQDLADLIARDPRHEHFNVLIREDIERREFADWSMGCFHVELAHRHDAQRLQTAMREFLADSNEGIREALGFFRLFLRFEREHI